MISKLQRPQLPDSIIEAANPGEDTVALHVAENDTAEELQARNAFKIADLSLPADVPGIINISSTRELGMHQDLSLLPEAQKDQVRVLELAKCLAGVPTNLVMLYFVRIKDGHKPSEEVLRSLSAYYYFLTGSQFNPEKIDEQIDEMFDLSVVSSSSHVHFVGTFDDLDDRNLVSREVAELIDEETEQAINQANCSETAQETLQAVKSGEAKKSTAIRALCAMQEFPLVRAEVLNWFFDTFSDQLPALTDAEKKALLRIALKGYEAVPEWQIISPEKAEELQIAIVILTQNPDNAQIIRRISINGVEDVTDVFINCVNTLHIHLQSRAAGLV